MPAISNTTSNNPIGASVALPSSTIGIDLGDRHSDLCVLDVGGEVLEETRLPSTPAAFRQRFAGMPSARIAIEVGTNSPWVNALLTELGHEVIVANPRKLQAIYQSNSFDSGLRLNVHFHIQWLDGVYSWEPGTKVEWCAHGGVSDDDVSKLVKVIRDRVLRRLKRMGKWPDEASGGEEVDGGSGEEQLLLELGSAAVQGRAALGEHAGQRDVRAGRGTRDEPFVKGPLCADIDGFSLHAGVVVSGHDRERLEKLLRYAGRPAIAESRLSLLPDGRVCYSLKRRWTDGSTSVVLSPQVLIERLIALGRARPQRVALGATTAATPGDVSRRVGAGGGLAFADRAAGGGGGRA
ncbi:MAG: hypothetical protein GY733_10295 [bacterium]|nr:hypothetical protein [bacterium]